MSQFADTIITAGRIRTMKAGSEAGCANDCDTIAISDGLVSAIGRRHDLAGLAGPQTRQLEFRDATIVPGLVDSHMHPIYSLNVARGASLVGITDYDELHAALLQAAADQAGEDWFFAWGLDPNAFDGRPVGNQILHQVLGEHRPAYVKMFDAHAAIASQAALARAGIKAPFANSDGSAATDDGTGGLSGHLLEFPAMDIVEAVIPLPTFADRAAQLTRLLEQMAATGITTGHVMDLKDPDALQLLEAIEEAGELPVRLRISPWCEPGSTDADVAEMIALQGQHGRRYRVEGIKFFIDGTIEGGTAWLEEPDGCGQCLSSTWADSGAYRARVQQFHRHGVPTATHAIGDRGIRFVADTLADLPASITQHRIEHIETVDLDVIEKIAAAGIAASMQPTHCTNFVRADGKDDWSSRLGAARAGRAWRTADVRRSGGILALGSDWPVAPYNPWVIMADAQLRRRFDRPASESIGADQALSAFEALEGYTTHAHRSIGSTGGMLTIGGPADLVVVDVDPLAADPATVALAQPLLTLVAGQITHQSDIAHTVTS